MKNTRTFDVVVIGGGVLGCHAARNLCRWNLSVALLEEKKDVCTGITRANSAIVYPGYDNQPGSVKAQMSVRACASFDRLCEELEVSFVRRGSLMVSFGPNADRVLEKKLRHGLENGVPGLRLISGDEACAIEPMLSSDVTKALYCPSTGTVNPWQFGIAAFENAVHNGCVPMLNTKVLGISKTGYHYIIETDTGSVECRAVLNCAGLAADKVQEMLFAPSVRLFFDASDYFVMDRTMRTPEHIIFHESEDKGKGITAVPTIEGNLLLESPARPLSSPGESVQTIAAAFSTDTGSLTTLRRTVSQMLPDVDFHQIIRTFGAIRPNPHKVIYQDGQWVPDGKGISSFVIEHPAPGFYSLIGIKTPGLTCADQLGAYLADACACELDAAPNKNFDPHRKAIVQVHTMDFDTRSVLAAENPEYADIVCQCGDISRAEIREAILRGARTPEGVFQRLGASDLDGVKRRIGAGMGHCQGSRCSYEIQRMINELTNP